MDGEPSKGERASVRPASLAEVQACLYDLITAPEGVESRLRELGRPAGALESIVRSRGRLDAAARVDVYANMYFYRILDVLRDEYAHVVAALGDTAFHNLVTDYLLACRPDHPSLREAGARLPAFLAGHPLAEGRAWIADLARLERLHLELYDGPDAEPMSLADVRALSPEALPSLVLRAIPCHAVIDARFAISAPWRQLDAPGPEGMPSSITCEEEPETLLVWRQGFVVYHRTVDPHEKTVLPLLGTGARFDVVCERLLENVAVDQAAARAFGLLAGWITEGLVVATSVGKGR